MRFSQAIVAAAILFGSTAFAGASQATVFDFESLSPGSYTTASQTVGGLTATFTDSGGGSFDIYDSAGGIPGESGNTLIDYTGFDNGGAGPVNANFSSAVSDVSVTGGDFGEDTDHITLAAYSGLNGTGTLLGFVEGPDCCAVVAGSDTVSLDVSGIESVQFYSAYTDEFPGSVFFDNLTVTSAAPEPASWALMIVGLGGVGLTFRRARRPGLARIANIPAA